MRLSSYLFKAILICLAAAILLLAVIAIKNGQTSHDGWDWGLEFMAGLLANVVASLLFVLWFESESARHLEQLLNHRDNPGSRVIPHRDRLARQTYEKHFDTSYEIDVLGVACKPILSGLFPNYEGGQEPFSLEDCQGSALYRRLTNGDPFKANIYFLSADAAYAAERESEAENQGTLQDLKTAVQAIEAIAHAYRNVPAALQERWKLTGTLSFRVFDCHPVNSIFSARKYDGNQDVLIVGYLFYTVPGVCCPAVEFAHRIEGEVFNQCERHLGAIRAQSRQLFIWDERGPRMCE